MSKGVGPCAFARHLMSDSLDKQALMAVVGRTVLLHNNLYPNSGWNLRHQHSSTIHT